ncbi:MAG: amino acid adenylation domain-containing protein, partial [Rhodococcus sp. (in: high G+C Gram-positive bacteria)]|uniref:amino acid adenylation domain-containing protein n=1 Tax=Rhodococcus sp. TaxID=1831 RepID=UPI003BAFEBA1
RRSRDRDFWAEQTTDLPDPVSLGRGTPLPESPAVVVGAPVPARVNAYLTRGGMGFTAIVVAAFAAFLSAMTGTEDILLALPVTARTTAALRRSAGSVSNVVPLRLRRVRSVSIAEAVRNAETAIIGALRHQRYRREDIGRDLSSGRADPTHFGPVINLMMFAQQISLGTVTGRIRVLTTGPVMDLAVNVYPGSDAVLPRIDFEANRSVYDDDDLAAHHQRFMTYLSRFTAELPSFPVGDLDVFVPGERRVFAPVQGSADAPPTTLDVLLTSALPHGAAAPALQSADGTVVTYRELDERSTRLARALIGRGIGPESLVAVAAPRSAESVTALWAIAKTGGAWVPIDPSHPIDRIAHTVTDCGARLGLATAASRDRLPDSLEWLPLDGPGAGALLEPYDPLPIDDRERTTPVRPEHPAYVIYTSGSTGTPKGVVVTHTGLANLAQEIRDKYAITARSRVLHLTSPTFDTALVEMLAAAITGATLVVASAAAVGGDELTALLRARRITHLLATPSVLATVDSAHLPDLKLVLSGGEACPPQLVQTWGTSRVMRNAYGPTETTCSVTLTEPLQPGAPITIGPLMRGVRAVVLDCRLQPLPPGAAGELYLAGPGLARGYRARAALTAAAFVADPLGAPGMRMYRTGDRVRWTDSGELEFLGRTDGQVKIHGVRIELGEIDSVLGEHPAVRFAASTVHRRPSGHHVLLSYVTTAGSVTVSTEELREWASKRLPRNLVPASITLLDAVPLTPTGKLDRSALPAPRFTGSARYRQPSTPDEELVAEIFADVLEVTGVGADHSFFDLGGDSLSATRVVGRIHERTGAVIGLRDVFDAPTVAALAARLTAPDTGADTPILGDIAVPQHIPLSPTQRGIDRTITDRGHYNLPFTIDIHGPLDHSALSHAVADLLARHPTLRTVYPDTDSGPCQRVLDVDAGLPDLTPVTVASGDALGHILNDGFDVRVHPPVRIRVVRHRPDHHVIACALHHIAVDGWSLALLARDLVHAYTARAAGTAPAWSTPRTDYVDYTLWKLALLGEPHTPDSALATQAAFWRNELAGLRGHLPMPTDRPRPTEWSHRGARWNFTLDASTHRTLHAAATRHGTGVFTALRAAVAVTFARLTGDPDIAVGVPVAGRGNPELDNLVGMFVNTLVLRTRVEPTMTFDQVIAAARDTELRAHANSDVPLDDLISILDPPRSAALHPFFQIAMSFENFPPAELDVDGLHFTITPRPPDIAKCDLHFFFTERRDAAGDVHGIDAQVLYATDLFDEATIRRFDSALRAVLAGVR